MCYSPRLVIADVYLAVMEAGRVEDQHPNQQDDLQPNGHEGVGGLTAEMSRPVNREDHIERNRVRHVHKQPALKWQVSDLVGWVVVFVLGSEGGEEGGGVCRSTLKIVQGNHVEVVFFGFIAAAAEPEGFVLPGRV